MKGHIKRLSNICVKKKETFRSFDELWDVSVFYDVLNRGGWLCAINLAVVYVRALCVE